MSPLVLGAGVATDEDLGLRTMPAAWRKATRNMMFATMAMQKAAAVAAELPKKLGIEMGLVLGTNSGELDASAEFLTTLHKSGVARPMLFQNSLHSATLGFAAIQLSACGPSMTVSDGIHSPTHCLEVAEMWLNSGLTQAVLVTLVEVHGVMGKMIDLVLPEGAASILLTTPALAESLPRIQPLAVDWTELKRPYRQIPLHAPLFDISSSSIFQFASQHGRKA